MVKAKPFYELHAQTGELGHCLFKRSILYTPDELDKEKYYEFFPYHHPDYGYEFNNYVYTIVNKKFSVRMKWSTLDGEVYSLRRLNII